MPSRVQRNYRPGSRRGRRARAFANSLAASMLAALLAVAVGLLAIRFNCVLELPLAGAPRVSARTREVLSQIEGTVRVTRFLTREHPLLRPVTRLLDGLQAAAVTAGGGAIEIVTVDPRRDLAAATRLAHLGTPPDSLIFEGHGRRMVIPAGALLAGDPSATNTAPRQPRFAGEAVCAAAIAQLGRVAPKVIYWLSGHAELDFADYSPLTGASDAAREIRREGFELRALSCRETHRVPADADVLVVAGPRRALAPEERGAIEEYLGRGGRLLFLAPPDGETGLETLLANWGIRVTRFLVATPQTLSDQETMIMRYGEHPATRNFKNTPTLFAAPRCLLPASPADTNSNSVDRARVTLLALTGPDGWADASAERPFRFDAAVDLPGPVAVAAAAELGGAAGVDVAFRPTRIVVFGEAAFAANALLGTRSDANRDLLLNALNWLADLNTAAAPSTGGDAALAIGLDRRGWLVFAGAMVIGVPAAVLAFGLLVIGVRRAGER